jgi:outer membrane protein W
MKKNLIITAVIIPLFQILAWSDTGSIGGHMGVGLANDHVDPGVSIHGYLELNLAPEFGLRGTLMYFGGDTEVDRLTDGTFSMFGAEVSAIFRLPSDKVTPYGGVGFGYYFPDNELSRDAKSALESIGVRAAEDIDDGIGLHIITGITFELTPGIDIDFSARYIYFKTDVEARVTSLANFQSVSLRENIDLSTLFITAGMRISF